MRGWLILVLALMCGVSARTRIDGVAAVVGDSVILLSELDAYTLLRMNAAGMKSDSLNIDSLRRRYLDELIDGRVLVVHAEKDTTITIADAEVDDALNRHIAMVLRENRMTMADLETELQRSQNMTMADFKKQMRKGLREQLLKQKLTERYVANLRLTRKDVEAFYTEYKDSLPSAGKCVRLSKIEVSVAPSDSVKQAAFERITKIKERLTAGADFAQMAVQYSEDPNAQAGGDLGFISKGSLSELAFEEKAFSLEPGQVSEVIETRLGFHLLKVEEKKDQRVHIRQIFIRIEPSAQRLATVRALLDSIRTAAATKESFAGAVRKFSTDQPTRARGGDMGWLSMYQLPSAVAQPVDSLPEGSVTGVIEGNSAMALYRVDARAENRAYTLADDWDLLAEKAKDIWAQKRLLEFVKKWRAEEFVDVRL